MTLTHVQQGERMTLSGVLTLDTVPELTKSFTVPAEVTEIDLAAVSRCDSAGLALLLRWIGQAQSQGQTINLVSPPKGMQALIELYDIEFLTLS
ncbi:STAS domain-containing protein [Ferrimonas aestuarii]|uniref:STAS domain-containing protein n=1 Tax=Ferrimonas aestuarii TaxID=2569539 RepID=A0A4U1BP47_9GAMM|nr:STAS domain-containing protein [Ferrimonas aestuarii]TKB55958.1 STAS domain-containing protein [Ferrimonas aestuarii]